MNRKREALCVMIGSGWFRKGYTDAREQAITEGQ